MDAIIVRDLRVQAHIGVSEEERSRPQSLTISVEISMDLSGAATSDDLKDTIDYARMTAEIEDLVTSTSSLLLENMAEKIAAHLAALPGAKGVTVEVAKDAPPIEQEVGRVAVRIERL